MVTGGTTGQCVNVKSLCQGKVIGRMQKSRRTLSQWTERPRETGLSSENPMIARVPLTVLKEGRNAISVSGSEEGSGMWDWSPNSESESLLRAIHYPSLYSNRHRTTFRRFSS